MQWLDVTILALATWRFASFLANQEKGPFDAFERFRRFVGVREKEDEETGEIVLYGTNTIAVGALCTWCCSVWFGVMWAALYVMNEQVAVIAALPFALSAIAIAIDKVVG